MRAPLRVLAADDELLARKRLERLLGAMPGVELLGVVESGEELLRRLPAEDCDVLVLDIRMQGLSGLEVRSLLPEDGPLVIFATAHADHAVEAFEVGAVDFVMKPVEAARLQKAMERARQRLSPAAPGAVERLAIETRQGVLLVDPARVTHVDLDGALTAVHGLDHGPLLTEASLQGLQERLPGFERVHRKALVNLAHVQRLEPVDSGGYTAHLSGGSAVPVSRAVARRLRRRLGLGGAGP